jgi:hypothetical protein
MMSRMAEGPADDLIRRRIAAWETAGLIDGATAERLRAAENGSSDATAPATAPPAAPPMAHGFVAALGPTPTVPEAFAYLGTAFVIAAYSAFVARLAGDPVNHDAVLFGGSLLGTVILFALAAWLAPRGVRARRGAGALALVGLNGAAVTAVAFTEWSGVRDGVAPEVFVAVVTLAVALGVRVLLPAITTQIGLLAAVTFGGGVALDVVGRAIDGTLGGLGHGGALSTDPIPLPSGNLGRDVLLPLVGWLLVALVLGVLGLREARQGTMAAAARADVTRFWAGIVAIAGTYAATSARTYDLDGNAHRLLETWIADAILLLVCAVLVERALRRESAALIVPAAIGVIGALTDLNVTYLQASTEAGLLIEGLILLAVGAVANQLRQRLTRTA